MKIINVFFALFLSASAIAQSLTWGNEIIVAPGSIYGAVRPRIALDAAGEPTVIWGGSTTTQPLWAADWNGTGFATPVQLSPAGVDPYMQVWTGAEMAAGGNAIYVVFKREPFTSNNAYLVKSTDGGQTWSDTIFIGGASSWLPSVAVTDNGNPVIVYMELLATGEYFTISSNDGGQTFTSPVNISSLAGTVACDCCPAYMDIEGNRQVVTWRRNSSNTRDIWMGVSNDGGATFPTGYDIDPTDWVVTSCPSVGPSPLLSGDSVITVYMSGASGGNRVYLSTANAITGQTGTSAMIAGSIPGTTMQTYPFIAGTGDTMIVVWQQTTSGNLDVWYSWSLTGATSLYSNAAIANSITTNTQAYPHVVYGNGAFHLTWRDAVTNSIIYRKATISPSSVEEQAISPVKVYPNPSGGNITIDLSAFQNNVAPKAIGIEVKDISGRIVESRKVTGESRVELTHQAAGTYLVVVRTEEMENYVTRIVFY
ncbi:MAG TPA: T9SS type A sorting domain-containing protein [Bacteroidia bacterium]|nr:T9SS type A sorting domain-containing protein [Bacteroidia bacterium]